MPARRPVLAVLAIVAAFVVGLVIVGPLLVGQRVGPVGGGAAPAAEGVNLARYDLGVGCYLMFEEGRFELGGATGSYLVVMDDGVIGDDPAIPDHETTIPLAWPRGVTARQDGGSTALVTARGDVLARAGGRAHIGGGYGSDGSYWACGESIASFPMP